MVEGPVREESVREESERAKSDIVGRDCTWMPASIMRATARARTENH